MTLPRAVRTFGRVVHGRIRPRVPLLAGLLVLMAAFALAGAAPALAAHAPAAGSAASAGAASEEAPPAPAAPSAQETDEPRQFAEPDTTNEGAWIIIAVALLIVLAVVGVGLAALGLAGE